MTWPPEGWRDTGLKVARAHRAEAMCQMAIGCVGMDAGDPAYVRGLAPWDAPEDAMAVATAHHKCILTSAMIARAVGYRFKWDGIAFAAMVATTRAESVLDEITRPHIASITTQVNLIQGMRGWTRGDRLPEPGQLFMLHNPSDERLLHCAICVKCTDTELVSVDGGKSGVYVARRRLAVSGESVQVLDDRWVRYMLGVVDMSKVTCSGTLIEPDRP